MIWIISLLTLFLLIRLIILRRKLSKVKRTDRFIEDLLKWMFTSEQEAWPYEIIRSRSKLHSKTLREYLMVAEHRGWIALDGPRKDIVIPTRAGLSYGAQISRTHRLIETFLAQKTGYPKDEWHARAEEMEHTLSPWDVEELSRELGNPLFDPNGEPIPTVQGRLPEMHYIRLGQASPGHYTVALLADTNQELFSLLTQKGLSVGARISIERSPNQEISIRFRNHTIQIPQKWQDALLLKNCQDEENPPTRSLLSLRPGQKAEVLGISPNIIGESRRRLSDLGFVKGGRVEIYRTSPFGRPIAYLIRDTAIAIREEQAENIMIRLIDEPAPEL